MQKIRHYFRYMIMGFRSSWFISGYSLLFFAFLIWFLVDDTFFSQFGISSETLVIFSGSVAALSGAMLAVIVAAIAFITQYSMSSFNNNKNILFTESNMLSLWLTRNEFNDIASYDILAESLVKIERMCLMASTASLEETEIEEWKNAINKSLDSFQGFVDDYKNKLHALNDRIDEFEAQNVAEDNEQYSDSIKQLELLKEKFNDVTELERHLYAISFAFPRMEASLTSLSSIRMMVRLSYLIAFTLIVSLFLLIVSGIQFSNTVWLLSAKGRLYWAIWLSLLLALDIPMIFNVIAVNLRILSIEVGREL